MESNKLGGYNKLIVFVSILVPVVVAILFTVRIPGVEPLTFLPPIYAGINALTAILLIVSVILIKNKKKIKLKLPNDITNSIQKGCAEKELRDLYKKHLENLEYFDSVSKLISEEYSTDNKLQTGN